MINLKTIERNYALVLKPELIIDTRCTNEMLIKSANNVLQLINIYILTGDTRLKQHQGIMQIATGLR